MLKLYEHYRLSGDITRQAWIRDFLVYISVGTEAEEEVNKHIQG
jgi:hypothetical protein